MNCGMRIYIVICICCVTGGDASSLILDYLQVIEICGGNDWGPYGAGVLEYGSCYGFVSVEECVLTLAP